MEHQEGKSLRLWPGVGIVGVMLAGRFGLKWAIPGFDGFSMGMLSTIGCVGIFLIWWLFFSRARWSERFGFFAFMIAIMAATFFLNHESMGPLWIIGYGIPLLCVVFIVSAVALRNLPNSRRRLGIGAAILLSSTVWTMVRTEGIDGDHVSDFSWRWSETVEHSLERDADTFFNKQNDVAMNTDLSDEWSGFRGADRRGSVTGIEVAINWNEKPPVELWRRKVGPGWSSFAVGAHRLYTQEQRGELEVVSCYNIETGEPIWRHHDKTRFFESNGGAGPRSTPTLQGEFVFALGATGVLNALNAADGSVKWSRDAAEDTNMEIPTWGLSGSPLVVDDLVIVGVSGALIAYKSSSGDIHWKGPSAGESYSSPHRVSIAGTDQILFMNKNGLVSVTPSTGVTLWQHLWEGFPIVQPALTDDGDMIVSVSQKKGVRRISASVDIKTQEWSITEKWTTTKMKPYFNDYVVHKGYIFGFDGRTLACLDENNGERLWKGGRYGNGQLLLLPDQDLLLVLSERGDLVLVEAKPEMHKELSKVKVLSGKTWNHPVLVGERLIARNATEMAAFQIPKKL